jgi:hypothetical protein
VGAADLICGPGREKMPSTDHQAIKERLLSFNPSTPEGAVKASLSEDLLELANSPLVVWNPPPVLDRLPVIKRGLYPQLVTGQVGLGALFRYRTAWFDVVPGRLGWYVEIVPRLGAMPLRLRAPTFNDAICVGKITTDLRLLRAHMGDYELTVMWDLIFEEAQELAMLGTRPTRAAVARSLALHEFEDDRHVSTLKWFNRLPLPERVQMIDDRLESARCQYGSPY